MKRRLSQAVGCDRNAFTLLELLVTISIIAILASLLLPVLMRGKVRVKDVKCESNLKQLAVADFAYVSDNQGVCCPDHHSETGVWMGGLRAYYSSVENIRLCPLAPDTNGSGVVDPFFGLRGTADKAWFWIPPAAPQTWSGSYGINGWLYPNKFAKGKSTMSDKQRVNMFMRESNISHSSATPIFSDSIWCEGFPKTNDPPAIDLYDGSSGNFEEAMNGSISMARIAIPRHGGYGPVKVPTHFDSGNRLPGAINVACFDGHVEAAKLETLWNFYWNQNWIPPVERPK